ncbi:MAG TPA: sulfurtransferase-like selenium metabolism protein YedF [Desulfuromonadales bacterium]|nr:sulfurtransferase-like selenium metabolism protein YedF [Desulfuromonadales bacterium]
METLDCRGQKCPSPVVETRKRLKETPIQSLQVLVGDTTARENVSRLARSQGYDVAVSETEGGFAIDLVAAGSPKAHPQEDTVRGKTIIFFGSNEMGSGDAELGKVLMKNFVFTLQDTETTPDALYFVNTGVKLTVEGSTVLEALEELACRGVDIASCGLCLEYFDLKDKLAVGRSTNMLEIAEELQTAGRLVRP